MSTYSVDRLSDGELLAGLKRLVTNSNQVTASLLAHIGEVDARRLYLPAGCSSMFAYCVRVLGLSEDATYKRIQAARAARRYPPIFELVASGRLHLAAVTLLAPYLAPGNHRELLEAAACLSKRDVERLIAHRFPSASAPAVVRRCPCGIPGAAASDAPMACVAASQPATREGCAPADSTVHDGDAAQLAPGQVGGHPDATYTVQFSAGEQFREKLRAAQDLLGHSVPRSDLARVFERALDALLRDLRRRKFGYTQRSVGGARREGAQVQRGRTIPAAVRREVAARDGEQCTYVDPASGRRCEAKTDLEFHHVEPFARGGPHDPTTLTLRCSAHNLHAARLDYGAEFIARKIAAASGVGPDDRESATRAPPLDGSPARAIGATAPTCAGPQIP